MDKDFVDDMSSAIDEGDAAMEDGAAQGHWLAQAGLDATADVLAIADTGKTVDLNPVVMLSLNVYPQVGTGFQTAGEALVSKIAIPRVGDRINIKYNPGAPTQFVVV